MKKGLLLFNLMFLFLLASCQNNSSNESPNEGNYELLSVNDFASKINQEENLQLLDVRTPREWTGGVLDGAIQLNMYDDNFYEKVNEKIDKSRPVYVYCQGGVRSKEVSNQLLKRGFENVYELKGGYSAWISNK